MKRTRTREEEWIECDGCQYELGLTRDEKAAGVTLESKISELRIPWRAGVLRFHFHAPHGQRHDCFRYWAHSPEVMRRSLLVRGFDTAETDAFLSTHLYRGDYDTAGIERPKATPR